MNRSKQLSTWVDKFWDFLRNWAISRLFDWVVSTFGVKYIAAIAGAIVSFLAYLVSKSQVVLVLTLVLLLAGNFVLGLTVVRLKRYGKWARSGNLWWLCLDLSGAINIAIDKKTPDRELEHQLLKCSHHAAALGISEQGVVRQLSRLWDNYASGYVNSTWPVQIQDEVVSQLKAIRDYVGQLAVEKQPDFDPGPNLL
jgi:hypothetical protein